MEVRYTDGPDALLLQAPGVPVDEVKRNEWTEVPNDVGKSLVAQGWESKTTTAARSAPKSEKE